MDRVKAAIVFNRICEQGSLSAAARVLDMSRPMVSRYLEQMEHWAGTRLLHRSTRKLSLTAAGERVLEQSRELVEVAERIADQQEAETPAGRLRVACARFTAEHMVMPWLPQFLARYPAMAVDLHVSNQAVNLVEERIDLAIRITNDLDPNVIARRLGDCESVLCASPDYLARHGRPTAPEQLALHNCLHYSHFSRGLWHFRQADGERLGLDVVGNFSANESSLLTNAARAGMGIALLPELEVRQSLSAGELVPVLEQLEPEPLGVFGLYRSRRHQPLALSLFLESLKAALPAG
ncbi:MAG: LysR family transcriptional regulator [Pseudomonadales bacterium]|nr:LysR family transcriptional regulator [Pseudomonadales bacterium]